MPNYGDRYRPSGLRMMPPAIGWLIAINVAIFIIGLIPLGGGEGTGAALRIGDYFEHFGALWPIREVQGSLFFRPWQYFTYMFLHDPHNFLHIFFNMLVLWMFGMEIEQTWGTRRFLAFYLLCGLGAGVIHSIVTMFFGGAGPTIGASGAIMGVMVAAGTMFPDRIVYINFFFPMRMKYLVLLYIGFDLFNGVRGTDGVAHFAHLGGALTGYLLLKFGGQLSLGGMFKRAPKISQQEAPPQPRPAAPGRIIDVDYRDLRKEQQPAQPPRPLPPVMNFGQDQARIDEILDKISRSGYQNLTEEEKTILSDASRRMK